MRSHGLCSLFTHIPIQHLPLTSAPSRAHSAHRNLLWIMPQNHLTPNPIKGWNAYRHHRRMSFLVLLKKKKISDKSGKWGSGVVVMPGKSWGGGLGRPGSVAVVSPSPPRLVRSPEENCHIPERVGESSTVSVQLKRKI